MASEPEQHLVLKNSGKAGSIEEIHTILLVNFALLALSTDPCVQLSVRVDSRLHEGHSKRGALCAGSVPQTLWFKVIEHKQDPVGHAALKGGQHGLDLLRLQCDEHEIVGRLLIKAIGDKYICTFTFKVDDALIALQLFQPE